MRAAHQHNGVRRKRAEVALQESEEPFRSLSASSPIGIFLTDTAGRCIYTNPRCQAICGFSFDEGLGLGWERFVYLEDREAVAKAWAACTREGREYSGEFRFQTPQGIVRWVHARTSPMLSEQGTLIGHVGTLEEITERKRAELLEHDRNSVLEMIARNEPLGDVLSRLAEMIERTLPDAICSVLLLRGGHLYHGSAPSLPDSYVQAVDGLEIGPQAGSCGMAAYRGETVIVRDVASDPLWERFQELAATYELRACWSVPILSGEEQVLGTFATYGYSWPRRTSDIGWPTGCTTAWPRSPPPLSSTSKRSPPPAARAHRWPGSSSSLRRSWHVARWERRGGSSLDFGRRRLMTSHWPRRSAWKSKRYAPMGWQVTYEEDLGGERLPPTIEMALYRVAQEALENTRKHAETTRAHVALRLRGQSVLLEARDWGCGFRPSSVLANAGPSKRVGLVGMQERISWLGGRCTVHSRPGAGTRIVGEIPLPRPSGGAPNGG